MGYCAIILALSWAIACLYKDSQGRQNVSLIIWLPVLWMMRVGSRSFEYWAGGGWADPLILSALTWLVIIALMSRTSQLSKLISENKFLWIFFVYLTLSTLWAGNGAVTFKRWIRAVGDLSMALLVLTELNPLAAILCVLRRTIVVLIPFSLVLSIFFPEIGNGQADAWIGVTVDKNQMGLLCVIASAYLSWHWVMRLRNSPLAKEIRIAGMPFEIPLLGVSLFMLLGGSTGSVSRSSTCIVLFALAVGVFGLIDYAGKKHLRMASLMAPIILLTLLLQVLPRATGHRTLVDHVIEDLLHKNANLTDRVVFWPLLLKRGMEHPYFGRGLDGFFTPEMQEEIQNELAKDEIYFKPNQAHNGYLEVFLSLGIMGLGLLILLILSALRNLPKLKETDFEYARVRLVLLICVLVSNWTEASFARPTEFIGFLFLLVAINPNTPKFGTFLVVTQVGQQLHRSSEWVPAGWKYHGVEAS